MTDDQLGLIFAAVALPDDWQDRTAHPVTEGTDVVDGQMLEGKRKRIVRAFLDGNIDEPAYSVGRPKSTSKSRGQPPAWSSPLSRRRHGGVGGDGGESNSPSREGPARGPTGVSGGWFSSGGPSPARRHRTEPMILGGQYRRQAAAPRLVGAAPLPIGGRPAGDVTALLRGESEVSFAWYRLAASLTR